MEENSVSLFEINENGEVVYDSVTESTDTESEVLENGNDVVENADTGTVLSDEVESEEVSEETQETVVLGGNGDAVPVVLSDEVTTALLDATTPASGSLASSTLDYFDRIVSSLPTDYVFVAYRTNADNSYDGVLYYGDDFDISDNTIVFGNGSRQIHVERTTDSGYSAVTEYLEYDATDTSITLSRSGDVVYYTNVGVGYPVLGGYEKPVEFSMFLVVGLVSAMAVVALQKLILRR